MQNNNENNSRSSEEEIHFNTIKEMGAVKADS